MAATTQHIHSNIPPFRAQRIQAKLSAYHMNTMGKNRQADKGAKTGTPNKKTKSATQSTTNKGNSDWLDSLVQKSVVQNNTTILSKEERKRKREAKKVKRQQQKEQKVGAVPTTKRAPSEEKNKLDASSSSRISNRRIKCISTSLEDVRKKIYGSSGSAKNNIKLYNATTAAKSIATKKRKLHKGWSEDSIQPRPSDYSGIGLARQSLYIEFVDPSYFPKLEEEFREHIPGFFGKQRTKAMKKQTDGNMLWRQLQDKKSNMSKKLKNMNPDERVQAMIDSGMI